MSGESEDGKIINLFHEHEDASLDEFAVFKLPTKEDQKNYLRSVMETMEDPQYPVSELYLETETNSDFVEESSYE